MLDRTNLKTETKPDGIYFGMSEDDYLAIPRLSSSGIKTMCVSTLDFWFDSWMNASREPETETPARALGKAYHKLILEGDDAFDALYAVPPEKADYPEAVDGHAALKEVCADLGLKKGGKIAELCARIREKDPTIPLWFDIVEDFRRANGNKRYLAKSQWQEIQKMRFVLQRMPNIRSAFTGGFPEVSILWTQDGVPMKARFDYLKPRGMSAGILDAKTFGNIMSKPVEEIPASEIARNKYFVQAVVHTAGLKAMNAMWSRDKMDCVQVVSGNCPDSAWLDAVLLAPKSPHFHFVFLQTGGVPNIIVRGFAEGTDYSGLSFQAHEYWRKGLSEFRYGVSMFKACMEKYGPDVPWIQDYGVRDLRDDEFPLWSLQQNLPILEEEAVNG